MKKIFIIFSLLMLVAILSVAQEHDPVQFNCKLYIPKPKPTGSDTFKRCMVCIEEEKKESEERDIKKKSDDKKYREAMEQKQLLWKAEKKAAKDALDQRNSTALAQLNNLVKESKDYDRIRKEENSRKQGLQKQYTEQVEKSSRDYNDFLKELQNATIKVSNTQQDKFWNETVSPANYIVFKYNQTGGYGMDRYGYKDRQENIKITAQYNYASNFSGGVGYVSEVLQNNSTINRLINSKGETIKSFNSIFYQEISNQIGINIQNHSRPDTISEGIIILELYNSFHDKNKTGGLDNKGNLIIRPAFDKIVGFKNGVSIARKYLDEEDYEFKENARHYLAKYTFYEVGLIDRKGNWIETPKKKLVYKYWTYKSGYLVIESMNAPYLSPAEKKARDKQHEIAAQKLYDKNINELEDAVKKRVAAAQAQGFLIEQIK